MKTVGLFAGIGGIEAGLMRAGHECELLCEIDPAARAVLESRFPGLPIERDVSKLRGLPAGVELLAAGFPCQDLSQAGMTGGIDGERSSLVNEVFRLARTHDVPNLLLENVSFMLALHRGAAIRHIVDRLEKLRYDWAYRVLDSRAFGLPQRRERVFIFASKEVRPWEFLFHGEEQAPPEPDFRGKACGFYWTEGTRGLGWAVDAIPTLKGGSAIGIPSAPAIWLPDGRIVTPEIGDAERLQGFAEDWTNPAIAVTKPGYRWKLVGNAVSVPVAEWIGRAISRRSGIRVPHVAFDEHKTWPKAAFGSKADGRFAVAVSTWPVRTSREPLDRFLRREPKLLSRKATQGFVARLKASCLSYAPEFMAALERHLAAMERAGLREAA